MTYRKAGLGQPLLQTEYRSNQKGEEKTTVRKKIR